MKSKRCSHNLQGDQQVSCQRILALIMRITSKIHRSMVLRRKKNMVVEGGTVSHYYILVISKFIDFMSLFRHSVWFSFSVKQIPFKVASRYRAFSSSCGLFIRIVLNFNFGFKVLTDRNKRSEML